jgi:hypothetical protein
VSSTSSRLPRVPWVSLLLLHAPHGCVLPGKDALWVGPRCTRQLYTMCCCSLQQDVVQLRRALKTRSPCQLITSWWFRSPQSCGGCASRMTVRAWRALHLHVMLVISLPVNARRPTTAHGMHNRCHSCPLLSCATAGHMAPATTGVS